MPAIGRGKAKDVGTKFWDIVNASGGRITVFDHDRFPHIISGAQVQFWDEDGNGIAEHVQLVANLAEVMNMAIEGEQRFGWGARKMLEAFVLKSISEGGDVKRDICPQLVAVRKGIGDDGVLTLTLLRANGVALN